LLAENESGVRLGESLPTVYAVTITVVFNPILSDYPIKNCPLAVIISDSI